MACGCGGSTQRASQRTPTSTDKIPGDSRGPVSLNDPSLYWNGPNKAIQPQQHSRRQQD